MTTWSADRLAVAYDDRLLDWRLGAGHPTNPVRAKLAIEALGELGVPMDVQPITWELIDELALVHTPEYVDRALVDGRNSEWSGSQRDLGAVAAHMFAATVQLVHAIDAGDVRVGFSPQGAKHHAMADRGSGFCVFNDMAWAAKHFAAQGKRVLYVDLDAHHGDGVEALTRAEPLVMTCSVHDSTIFPGTGHGHAPDHCVYNYALPAGSGDEELLRSVEAIRVLAESWQPQILLIAIGADGHETDPLSTLQYTYDGYREAAEMLGRLAARHDVPVLMGGAGGYQPETHTPQVWAAFVARLWATYRAGAEAGTGADTPAASERDPGQTKRKGIDMKDDVLRQMDQFGCAPALRALVERLPEDLGVVVKAGVGDFLPLAAADDCVAGVYMDRGHLHLLLTPSEAKAVSDATGCGMTKTNQETGYLKVLTEDAADERIAPRLQAAFDAAMRRSATRCGTGPRDERVFGGGQRPQRTCPETFELVPANGICDVHGA